MSQNGILNISRDDAGESRRVFILKNNNGGCEANTSDGRAVSQLLSRSPTINSVSSQHGGSVTDNGRIVNSESDNVINGMLRSGDEVDPTSDLGVDLQHIEEWLKTRSDSLSSFDFDPDIKPSEIDESDFLNLKGNVQLNVGGQDYGLVLSKDGAGESCGTLHSQLSFPDLGDSLCGTSSRRSSFTKKLETLMQVDKGLFEELLLTDPNKKHGSKRVENGLSLPTEDRGLFEELLLPGGQEEWARHTQELLLAVSLEKKETEASDPSPLADRDEGLSGAMSCSVSLPESTQETPVNETADDLEMMVNNIQPIKLMSPQEIENMATRPLGFDETPIKTEEQRNREVSRRLEEEDFNFYPFGSRPSEDSSTLPADLLTSPNSDVDSKLSSILAMDASNDPLEIQSNDPLEIQSPESSDMLESFSKTPPKLERSISPGTFLVKLEPRESQTNLDLVGNKSTNARCSSTSSHPIVSMPPPISGSSTAASIFSTFLPSSVLDVSDITTTAMIGAETSTVSSSQVPVTANITKTFSSATTTTTITTPTASVNIAPKSLLKIPGLMQAALKKLPINMVQSKVATVPVSSSISSVTTSVSSTTTNTSPQVVRPALIIRPLMQNAHQQQVRPSQQIDTRSDSVAKESAPLTLTPLKVVALQSNKPGTANVTITVDRKANLTTVNIVSSNNEHTLFKINTCDLVRAVSSIREPHLDPLGLSPEQLLRSAHTAHRLIQEVHQQGSARQRKGGKEASSGPQNFEINQVLQEAKAPISRMQQGQLALLRQATSVSSAPLTTVASHNNNTNKTEADKGPTTSNVITGLNSALIEAPTLVRSVTTSSSSLISTSQATAVTGTVLSSGKAATFKSIGPKLPSDGVTPVKNFSRLSNITTEKCSVVKNEGVGVSLRPGAPPTMVSVPSVLDTLSASSLLSADLLQESGQSPSSSKNQLNDDDLNDENPEMCTVSDEVANKALEDLGIRIDNLIFELSPQGGKRWLCPIQGCSKYFPKLSSLKVHLLSHNGIRPYKCSYENCDWAFYTWYKLKRHIETHLKRRDFACSEANCNRRFTTIYNLNTHIRLHQRPRCWICSVPECTRAYHTRRELEAHMKTHKDIEAPYKCGEDGCSKSYFTPNSLTSHMRSHHKEEELCCQWNGCGKKFDKPCRLKAHMRVHTGQRPFVCTFNGCNWSFQSASKLSRHQRKHTNDRKFTCHLCMKSFLRSEHLKGHLLIHTGVRNFQCPVENCSAKFTAKSSLYVHLKKHEGKSKESSAKVTYHCPIDCCDRSYNSKFNLRQHMVKNHTILAAADSNQLDYITLLGDKDLMMDPLLPLTAGSTSSSASSTLDPHIPSSTFASTSHSSDPHTALLSSIELINGDISSGDISSDANNIAPIIVMEGRGSSDGIESMDVGIPESLIGGTAGTGGADVETLDLQSVSSDNGGSARTDALGNFIQSQRAKKRQQLNLAKKMAELGCHSTHSSGEVVNFTNDVVLSASAVTLSSVSHLQSALLQDDCVGSELYQEALMGHELLTDPSTDPQSTINLRDLE
ncbi:uncharacterized protein [Palaemon carinicauda]|uniref:uncharacterized protein n=1 Tax=Palaemon carinicauda TaxID=392227 RepID=UPI0035B655FA